MIELKGNEPKQLEKQLWAGMMRWVKKGGKLKDGMWGVVWSEVEREFIPSYSKNSSYCACAIGSNLLCPPTKKTPACNPLVLGKVAIHGGDLYEASEAMFHLDDDEVSAVIYGFDEPLLSNEASKELRKESISKSDRVFQQYHQVGQNLRRRAQKLGKNVWVGSKG